MSKNKLHSMIIISLLLIGSTIAGAQSSDITLLFNKPAKVFQEALPLGNGRLGALIGGNPNSDKISLNEISLWSGGVQNADNDSAKYYLPEIQSLLLKGQNKEAQTLLQKHFVAKGLGSGFGNGKNAPYGCYQTLGDLWIRWTDTLSNYTNYKRTLDLENAIAKTSWERNGIKFTQEAFISIPDNVLIIKLTSSSKGKISFSTTLSRKENAEVSLKNKKIIMTGQLPNAEKSGMRFAAALHINAKGGKLFTKGNEIEIQAADECVLMLTAATDYNITDYTKRGNDPLPAVFKTLTAATEIPLSKIKKDHIQTFSNYFNHSRFYLYSNPAPADSLSTSERLQRFANDGVDVQLPVLYYNFGRYLLISSSRPGSLPANLQGLWATEYQTPWNGDYHIDINLQMNYWLAEPTGLGDLAEPLFRFIHGLVKPGSKTAKAYYNAQGWVAHVICNPWGYTSPGEGASWGSTLTGGAWLCGHIWEHFRFTRDTAFLEKYYPVLKGSAEFLSSVLIEEPANNRLVTAPSNSPENTYIMPDGYKGQTCMGPTMDMQICREIFAYCSKAAGILNKDKLPALRFDSIRKRLAPNQIGAAGDLNEWLDDWKDAEPHHRHTSHLYGLHPYDEITPWHTPELANAARETLLQRGDEGTGWSKAWKINFWARLGDGDHALLLLRQLLKPVDPTDATSMSGGGTFPNLFCAHPPFQIDGNFGGTAGIAEMLLQSHGEENVIRILPALPGDPAWKTGKITGMRARNAFVLNFEWKNGKLISGMIKSMKGLPCKILLPPNTQVRTKSGETIATAGSKEEIKKFNTVKDGEYFIEVND